MGEYVKASFVVEHGLPNLPLGIGTDDVPIARWVGPRYGAVLYVCSSSWRDSDDDGFESDAQLLRLSDGGWVESECTGGGDWFDPPLERPTIGAREAYVMGEHGSANGDWSACAVFGVAGTDATVVEVEDEDGRYRWPIESPIGAWVACSGGDVEATVRVLDERGDALLEERFGGYVSLSG